MSTGPLHGYGYPLAVLVRIDEDSLNEQTKDSSAVKVRCCGRVPQDWQIGRESSDGFAFCGRQMTRLFVLPAAVFFLEGALGLKFLLPRAFERTDHETILRLDSLILALGALDLVPSSLETLLPKDIGPRALALDLFAYAHAHFERSGLQSIQRELRDCIVERTRAQP